MVSNCCNWQRLSGVTSFARMHLDSCFGTCPLTAGLLMVCNHFLSIVISRSGMKLKVLIEGEKSTNTLHY